MRKLQPRKHLDWACGLFIWVKGFCMAQPLLQIKLFGGFYLSYDNTPFNGVNSARLQSLLTYLILHADAPQSRQQVAFLLWPDKSESQARNNLRQFLFQLRQVLPDPNRFLYADSAAIYWKPDESQFIDLQIFVRSLQEADAFEQQGDHIGLQKLLEQAVSAYQGDLLPGCYDDWIAPEREHLRQQYQNACRKLMRLLEAQREYAVALQVGQKLIRFDPLYEETYVTLMRLYELNGDLAGARRLYHTAVEILDNELEIEPGESLRSAYERLQHGTRTPAPLGKDDPYLGASFSLVGRQPEWQTLKAVWNLASAGSARFVLITGEAGIGKSRLAEELFAWATLQGFTTAYTRSYAAEGSLSFAPVTELLRSTVMRLHWCTLDPVWLTEIARLVPEILTELPDLARPEPITEYGQRQRFFEALTRAVLAAPQPLLLWIDDLQWSDQETLEWLHFLLRFKPDHALFILGTARSEEAPPNHPISLLVQQLQIEDKITVIDLAALDAAEISGLASQVRGLDVNTAETIRLYRETEGNPLFVIETIRAGMIGTQILETEGSLDPTFRESHVPPPRVYAVILRRLSQLSPSARKMVELSAVIGRAFHFDLLVRAGSDNEETVVDALDELSQRRVIRQQSANIFDFTHDKLREVAYWEISAPRRGLLHRNVAQALQNVHAEHLEAISGQLAVHYEHAGLTPQALAYYEKAFIWAQHMFAHREAIRLLHKALTLVETLSPKRERYEQELALQTYLGISMVSTKGYGAPEVLKVYTRAQELCNQLGKPVTSPILRALAIAHLSLTEFDQALIIGNQLLERATQEQDKLLLVEAYYILGVTLSWQGVFNKSCQELKQAVDYYDPSQAHTHIALYSQDPKAVCLMRQAFDLACLGYPEQADRVSQDSQAYALELSHPFTRAYIMFWDTLHYQYRREIQKTLELAESTILFCSEYQIEYWRSLALVFHGWALAEQTNFEVGIAEMEQGIFAFQAAGGEFLQPYYRAMLGEQYGRQGDIEKGLTFVNEGIERVEQSGEKWCESELFRIKGDLLLTQRENTEAEIALRHAVIVAQEQEAKLLELRAALSLAQLWFTNSRATEAKQLLIPVYEWFTEGFDTPDLQSARTLITQL